jgi:2-oxoglutarate dehydrogenase E2 component (dihydrolipoamide succinyltransferase)
MSTEILMPQMGESVAEGTIVRWIKRVGDAVDKDEPLFEISTDKVDAEIPSPGAGVLLEIRAQEGETVPVHSVVGVIGVGGTLETGVQPGASTEVSPAAAPPAPAAGPGRSAPPAAPARPAEEPEPNRPVRLSSPAASASPVLTGEAVPPVVPVLPVAGSRLRTLSSPLVRTIARKHGVDITRVPGTGVSGRVTKRDIEAYIAAGGARKGAGGRPAIDFAEGAETHVEKMSVMRRKIADHMTASIRTSAHVYSAYEADFGQVDRLRREHKARYEAAGTALTYTAFIAKAAADTIREFPYVNASLDGENVVYHKDINIGIAVALDQGLIVPVIRRADRLSILDLCRVIQDLAHRARTKQLKHEDVEAGTFTITNPGIFGGLWGLPIISQPQVAILAVGSVDKRVVVVDDEMTIRPMCYLTLGYDHRLIDGADGGRFLQALKNRLERFDEALL